MAKKSSGKSVRHPTEKKVQKPTPSPPFISIATRERDLLRYLHKTNNQRFNVRDYSKNIAKIPRSTVYDYLNKLEKLGLVKRDLANNKITEKGIIYLDATENKGVGASRRECRNINKLSTHYHKFKLPISEKKNFSLHRLKSLNPQNVKENKLHNLHQTIVYFDDATIIVNPKQMIINLYDVLTDDVDEADIKCLNRAIEYAKLFRGVGIETEGLVIEEEGHWARVDSVLSELLYEKVDNKYFLDLGEGKKFWIDHSFKREDETNDKVIRERVDRMLTEISNNDISLLDINKITQALGFILKLESARLMNEIDARKELREKQEKIELQRKSELENREGSLSYFG